MAMKRVGLMVVIAVLIVVVAYRAGWVEPAPRQPVQFPHKTHVEMNLECTSCHDRAEKGREAGRPAIAVCLTCHNGQDGQGEIRKVQMFGERGVEIPWRRVFRLPPHVYFPHRPHVVVAKVKCQTCHGPMETLTRPPDRPLKRLTMNDCIGCHESWQRPAGDVQLVAARRLATDCTTCHR